jgi:hypothetical protein
MGPMTACGTKQSFSGDSQNDCFRVLSGSSVVQWLLLGVERTLTPAARHGSC